MRKLTRWFLPISLAVLGILVFVAPVLAAVSHPDTFEIQEVVAYENYHLDDAQLYIITYLIDYDTLPNEDADELFIFQLLDEDNDPITSRNPYAYHDRGYGQGVVALYVELGDAPDWEGDVTVRIIGDPIVDWEGGLPNTVASNSSITWETGTTTEIQELVSAKVLELATDLEAAWDVDMVTTTDGVATLTDIGATYFLNVIPYLAEEAPSTVGEYVFNPNWPNEDRDINVTYSEQLETGIEDTIFDLSGPARSFGVSRGSSTAALYYLFVAAFFILLTYKGKLNKGTMLLAWPFVIAGAFFGVPLIVTIIGGFLCLISTVWVFYKGAY